MVACDNAGEIETGSSVQGGIGGGHFCTDPLKRGYNVCVSVLPHDFAEKTNGFCFNSTLNNAAATQWFSEKNGHWNSIKKPIFSNHFTKNKSDFIPKRDLKTGISDMYEVQSLKNCNNGIQENDDEVTSMKCDGSWWPLTLTMPRQDVGTYEGLIYDQNLRPEQLSGEIDGSMVRSYSDLDWGEGDIVMLTKDGISNKGGISMYEKVANFKKKNIMLTPGEVGVIKAIEPNNGFMKKSEENLKIKIVDSVGMKHTFLKKYLTHAGRNRNIEQISRLKYLQLGGEYIMRYKNEERYVTIVDKGDGSGSYAGGNKTKMITVEMYNPAEENWKTINGVRPEELRLIPGIDMGQTYNVCEKHVGRPMCVTARALYRYLHDKSDPSRMAIEV